MNQHDQMLREALLCAEVTLRSVLEYPDFDCDCEQEPRPICSMAKRAVAAIEQALAHVNEAPKNEHDSAEGFILASDPSAPEPVFHGCTFSAGSKLVRLTTQQKAEVLRNVASELEDSLAFNMGHAHRVADAIQDAMQEKNK